MCILTVLLQPMVFHLEKLLRRQQDLTDLTLCFLFHLVYDGKTFSLTAEDQDRTAYTREYRYLRDGLKCLIQLISLRRIPVLSCNMS